MTTLTNQSLTLNSRVSVAAGIAFTLNVPTPYATIISISSDEYTVQFDNGVITTVYVGDMTLLEEPTQSNNMTYTQWVDDVFTEHHSCSGFDLEEISDMIEDSTFDQRKSWLSRNGYNVSMDEYNLQMS